MVWAHPMYYRWCEHTLCTTDGVSTPSVLQMKKLNPLLYSAVDLLHVSCVCLLKLCSVFSAEQKIQNGDVCQAYCVWCELQWSTSNNTVRRLEQLWFVVVHAGTLHNWWRSVQTHPNKSKPISEANYSLQKWTRICVAYWVCFMIPLHCTIHVHRATTVKQACDSLTQVY
jgi:hypothetical protein